ncbi:hypothetical protein [Glutamicibacter sp.]|uniref:hypothetical protein n=1 Tax=Glutamicibacter sp. TaxID=1931995 RepID=UPI003D6C14CE
MMRAPVWAAKLPAAIDSFGKAAQALEILFGEGLTFGQSGQYLIVYARGRSATA